MYAHRTYATLEFDVILRQLAQHAVAETVQARCLALTPADTLVDAQRRMDETTQARRIIESTGTPPLAPIAELRKALDLASLGAMLSPEQLGQITAFLVACRRMKGYLQKAEITGANVAGYGGSIDALGELEEEIERCIRSGQVDDRASSHLSGLRRAIATIGEQIKTRLESLLRKHPTWFSDSFIAQRGGRYTLPVKKEYKASIPGSLVELSSSGSTCFIEPSSVRTLQEERNERVVEEDAEVRRILYELTAEVHAYAPVMHRNIEAMETLDYLFAKAKLSLAMGAAPVRLTAGRDMRVLNARHPLLDPRGAVPLDFALGTLPGARDPLRGVVVTGPNTGGKTVTLKTIGLLSLMAQSGLHVPASPDSTFPMRRAVFCDIGDGQSITENLSTFSSHLTNILAILQDADRDALVLLDELGSGTDPAEGMGIAVAILDALGAMGCAFVATTHYPEIKEYAAQTPGLTNARMAFDRESLLPLYRLELGEAGESCALHIAQRLGMPAGMLARARLAAYGEDAPETAAKAPAQSAVAPAAPVVRSVQALPPEEVAPAPVAPRSQRFQIGDSVTVHPRRDVGIVYARANAQGEVGVQVHGKKLLINHKRLQLKVAASELYPDDYDLSIVLDSVANRKARHLMDKRHEAGNTIVVRSPTER